VVEEKLFARSEDELSAAIGAFQSPILELHASSLLRCCAGTQCASTFSRPPNWTATLGSARPHGEVCGDAWTMRRGAQLKVRLVAQPLALGPFRFLCVFP